jgi:hypothetical protein
MPTEMNSGMPVITLDIVLLVTFQSSRRNIKSCDTNAGIEIPEDRNEVGQTKRRLPRLTRQQQLENNASNTVSARGGTPS